MDKGILFLVATPIGNLGDITIRALKTLKEVDYIVAEDTRQTLKLLNHFEISKPLLSYHRHSSESKEIEIIQLLIEGKNIAIVSDAGTPAISDPGEKLVKRAIENNIKIEPIPGACALINALIASGLDTDKFAFYGFLPQNNKNRKEILEQIKQENKTLILYEAPHKIKETLIDLSDILGSRKIVLAREITKIHEEYIRGNIDDVIKNVENPKGEYVIIIEKSSLNKKEKEIELLNNKTLEEHYEYYKNKGIEKKEIIKKIAKDRNVQRNEIYKYFLNYN